MLTVDSPTMTSAHRGVRPRTVVASLWLFAILNYLYCDVLSLHYSEDLEQLLTGTIGGLKMSQSFLLAAGILMSIPMGMVLVSRIAPHAVARWASVIAAIVMTVVQAGSLAVGTDPTLHYLYFSAIEITTTVVIAWYAATRWRTDDVAH